LDYVLSSLKQLLLNKKNVSTTESQHSTRKPLSQESLSFTGKLMFFKKTSSEGNHSSTGKNCIFHEFLLQNMPLSPVLLTCQGPRKGQKADKEEERAEEKHKRK
jgi:hypothetical protein